MVLENCIFHFDIYALNPVRFIFWTSSIYVIRHLGNREKCTVHVGCEYAFASKKDSFFRTVFLLWGILARMLFMKFDCRTHTIPIPYYSCLCDLRKAGNYCWRRCNTLQTFKYDFLLTEESKVSYLGPIRNYIRNKTVKIRVFDDGRITITRRRA